MALKTISKTLVTNLLCSSIVWTLIYLVRAFIIWDLQNPFNWIINIPKYTPETRFIILFYVIAYQIAQITFTYKILINKIWK